MNYQDDVDYQTIYMSIRTTFPQQLAEGLVRKLENDQFHEISLIHLLQIMEYRSDDEQSLQLLHNYVNSDSDDIVPQPKRGPGRPPRPPRELENDDEYVDIPRKNTRKPGDPIVLSNSHKPRDRVGGGQSLYTTFPARIKQGISTLMQPVNATLNPQGVIENKVNTNQMQNLVLQAALGSSRRRQAVNYQEKDISDYEEDYDSDEEPSSRRRSTRKPHYSDSHSSSTPMPGGARRGDQASYVGPYLGDLPPGSSIVSEYLEKDRMYRVGYASERELEHQADRTYLPVPIRLEIDTDNWRLRDNFVWNANERLLKPHIFAEALCHDLKIPLKPYADQITSLIIQQIDEHQSVVEVDNSHRERLKELSNGGLRDFEYETKIEDYEDYEKELLFLRDKPRQSPFVGNKQVDEVDGPAEDQDVGMNLETDLRVILNLDVQFATFHLRDKVEWDLCSPMPPEMFAESLCLDLGLSGEAKAAIAHVIHEELIRHKKEAIELGLMGASTGQRSDLDHQLFGGRGPKKLEGVWRDWQECDEFVPRLEYYTSSEIEKRELEREKSTRRMRRDISKSSSGFSNRRSRYR